MTTKKKILAGIVVVSSLLGLAVGGLFLPDRKPTPAPVAQMAPMAAAMDEVMALTPASSATATAVQSGNWSDPETWGGKTTAGGKVYIPAGITVTFDTVDSIVWLGNDGAFNVSPNATTGLTVETMTGMGSWQFGIPASPVTCSIVFADSGPIDTTYDPLLLSRGWIPMGPVQICGLPVTPNLFSTGNLAGQTTVTCLTPPVGWKIGDTLCLTGVSCTINDDENVTITAINGNVITLSAPLKFGHPQANLVNGIYTETTGQTTPVDYPAIVENITPRSVDFTSQNIATSRRGHIMIMNSNQCVASNFSVRNCGRSDTSIALTDPQVDANGVLIPATGTNPRARYPWHFHVNGGTLNVTTPFDVNNFLIDGSPSRGAVNHGSYGKYSYGVIRNCAGAGGFGENGAEIGSFENCVATRCQNPKYGPTGNVGAISGQLGNATWGFAGVGFWSQGGGLQFINTISTGCFVSLGIVATPFQRAIDPAPVTFARSNLQPGYTWPTANVPVNMVPQVVNGHIAIGCTHGVGPWGLNGNPAIDSHGNPATVPPIDWSVFTNIATRTIGPGVMRGYESFVKVSNAKAVCTNKAGTAGTPGFAHSGFGYNTQLDNCQSSNFPIGFQSDNQGLACSISNCTVYGPTGIWVMNIPSVPRVQTITNLTMFPLSAADATAWGKQPGYYRDIQGSQQAGVLMHPRQGGSDVLQAAIYNTTPLGVSDFIPHFFSNVQRPANTWGVGWLNADTITLDGVTLWFPQTASNYALNNVPSIPSILSGLTNGQAWTQYGVALQGRILPTDAAPLPGHVAYYSPSGAAEIDLPPVAVNKGGPTQGSGGYQATTQATGYVATVKGLGGVAYSSAPTNLVPGWNIVPVTLDGYTRGIPVWQGPGTWPSPW